MTKTYFESWKQKANLTKLIVVDYFFTIDLTDTAWPVVDGPKRYEILDMKFGDDEVTLDYNETHFVGRGKYATEHKQATLKRTDIKRVTFFN